MLYYLKEQRWVFDKYPKISSLFCFKIVRFWSSPHPQFVLLFSSFVLFYSVVFVWFHFLLRFISICHYLGIIFFFLLLFFLLLLLSLCPSLVLCFSPSFLDTSLIYWFSYFCFPFVLILSSFNPHSPTSFYKLCSPIPFVFFYPWYMLSLSVV